MSEPFVFYKAVDPLKGSWDGYGFFPHSESDFIAYVTDAPSTASVHTPELIHAFWMEQSKNLASRNGSVDLAKIEFADAINRLQDSLQHRSRQDGSVYQATLSVAWKCGERLLYCAIGDSALQLLREGRLYRLSVNEVWDGALIMDQDHQYKERQKTGAPQIIGSDGEFIGFTQISELRLKQGDLLLMNSDGVEDLLPPQQLLSLLHSGESQLKNELERLFAPERLKDDATLLAIRIQTQGAVDLQSEIGSLRRELEKVQADQKQAVAELHRSSISPQRIEKIEKNLAQLSQQVQRAGKTQDKKQQAIIEQPQVATRNYLPKKNIQAKARLPWLLLVSVFLAGLILGLSFFLWNRPAPVRPKASPEQNKLPAANSVAPPQIASAQDCTYAIQKGDTLEKVALQKNITLETLLQLNPAIRKTSPLRVGERLTTCREGL